MIGFVFGEGGFILGTDTGHTRHVILSKTL